MISIQGAGVQLSPPNYSTTILSYTPAPCTGSATTEVSKVKAFFMEIFDHILITIEVHLVFCNFFSKKKWKIMKNHERIEKIEKKFEFFFTFFDL